MLNHPNIIEELDYDETIVLKFKDPVFSLFPRTVGQTCPAPLVVAAGKSLDKHINKTVFVAPFCSRYFHLLLEFFPLILELKNKVNLINLVITAPMPLDEETGLFIHFTKKYKYQYINNGIFNAECLDGIKSDFSIIPDFCKYFGINLICIPEHEFMGISFDYAYFIYGEKDPYIKDEFIFIDREAFNTQGIQKQIKKTNSLVPITIQKNSKDYHMLLPLKSRKDLVNNSFKILRESYPKFDIVPGKKIYVSRKKTPHRNIQEEQYIEEYFEKLNYNIVYFEELTFLEQSQVCQESEKIVCLYGSSLLNCGFCSNKTTIISIKYNIPARSVTINSSYNNIFREYSIQHIELEYNGKDLLDFIKNQENIW